MSGSMDTAAQMLENQVNDTGGMPMTSFLNKPLIDHFTALPEAWRKIAAPFIASPECAALCAFVDARITSGVEVYPPRPFAALHETAPDRVCAVILGQDPYHGPGQANGLAFSVREGVTTPPSLRNIFAELAADLGCGTPATGDLSRWARQGVLLLNAVLTVERGEPGRHAGKGWELFTDMIIGAAARDASPKVFLLWGAQAQAKRSLLVMPENGHLVLEANHPSPLSARRLPVPFLGCRHFSKANRYLEERGRGIIEWCG